VIMASKFQPTRDGSQRKTDRTETTHHLRDKNTNSEKEVQEIKAEGPSPAYQTRSIARQTVASPQSDEGDNSLENGSSSDGSGFNSEEESGNEATSSAAREPKPLQGDVLKDKTLGFRDSMCW
ncbi:hypothetical protein HAX54_044107, partial [Datura stramonium]|nr:hypothetical protein [Datura stramonium]